LEEDGLSTSGRGMFVDYQPKGQSTNPVYGSAYSVIPSKRKNSRDLEDGIKRKELAFWQINFDFEVVQIRLSSAL
jgi:hypothetical protein